MRPKFVATQNKGFGITFQNGFTISVQWGIENYCEHRSTYFSDTDDKDLPNPKEENRWESRNAEIAVFDKDGEIVSAGEHDDVIGWLTPDEVAKIIEIVSGYQGQTMTGVSGESYIKSEIKKANIK